MPRSDNAFSAHPSTQVPRAELSPASRGGLLLGGRRSGDRVRALASAHLMEAGGNVNEQKAYQPIRNGGRNAFYQRMVARARSRTDASTKPCAGMKRPKSRHAIRQSECVISWREKIYRAQMLTMRAGARKERAALVAGARDSREDRWKAGARSAVSGEAEEGDEAVLDFAIAVLDTSSSSVFAGAPDRSAKIAPHL